MGRFIVLEGLDGAGTTTQAERLAAWLRGDGRRVHQTCEPSEGPVGRLIRATLGGRPDAPAPSTLPWMFAADRADHLAREIEPALAIGDVVCDRYVPSSLAYQSLEHPLEFVDALNRTFRVPDLTLLLVLEPEIAWHRIAARSDERELFERRDRLAAVARSYARVSELLRARGERLVEIDASAGVDEVEARIRETVLRELG